MRVLLTDGSGLTARQVATQLASRGHVVEALSPDPLCLTRFTRTVRRVHRVPAYGPDPYGWLEAATAIYAAGRFDVLFPTQEQVAVLAREAARLHSDGIITAVPTFAALARVQDKVAAAATLTEAGLPQPRGTIAATAPELAAIDRGPLFVKTPIGTATSGVRYAADAAELRRIATDFDAVGAFRLGGVLAQCPVDGPLVMAQSVFEHGELVAVHANVRVREGARGGASHKRSIDLPAVRDDLAALGRHLGWHGALSADVILTDDGPVFIDINPRLVEPGNAWRSGVDLVDALLDVATSETATVRPSGRTGVRTHQLLLAVLGAAQHQQRRRAVAGELLAAWRHSGSYRHSVEELTPPRGDLRAAIPVAVAALATPTRPAAWRRLAGGSVAGYALTQQGWSAIAGSAPSSTTSVADPEPG
jgi:ATP-grasp domain